MNKFLKGLIMYVLIAFVIISIINMINPAEYLRPEQIDYSTFRDKLNQGQVSKVTIVDKQITGEYITGGKFRLTDPGDPNLIERLDQAGVRIEARESNNWLMALLPNLLIIGVLIVFWLFILRQMQGGSNKAMSFGKSKAKLHMESKIKVTFDDVAGIDEAKEELVEVVDFLKDPKKFVDIGAKIPKGVLLVGPPGTGKTLLGRAVAGEAEVPFFSISGSDFVEMFVGVGASRVRDMFNQAKKHAPCIVFVDEIDAVGRQRGAGLGGGHDEREQTLNQLLVEMDGFESNTGVIVIAATNRPDVLDPALLRPGRFDRQIHVDIPDIKGRELILKVHARGKPLAEDVNLSVLARRTVGFTGADLENALNEAALLTARRNKKKIAMKECEDAVERVVAGPEKKSRRISEKEKEIVAYHEAGHALVNAFLPETDAVHKVSIIPRGRAGGYTLMLPKEDRHNRTKSELLSWVTVALGGRVAEDFVLNEISTGAQNDLERATELVRKMICEYGMSSELGPLTFGKQDSDNVFLGRDISRKRDYSDEIAAAIDKEARSIVDECYNKARTILVENRETLEKVVNTLKEKETIEANEFRELVGLEKEPEEEKADKKGETRVAREEQPEEKEVKGHGGLAEPDPQRA